MPSEQLVLCEVFSLPISLPLPVQLFHGWPISCCSCPGSMCSLLAGSRNWNLNQLENQLVTNFWPFSILTHGLPPPHLFYTLWKYPFWYGVASPKFKHMSLPQSLPFDRCRNVTKAETQLDTHPPPRPTNLVSLRKNLFLPREVNAHRFPCSKRDNVPLERCMRLLLHVSCVHQHVHCAGTCANIQICA